jgi:hypothetical protein
MLRNMLHHAGAELSEPMLFGLGQGIDFQYHEAPGPTPGTPMLTGRIATGEVARNACAALGLELVEAQADDDATAHAEVASLIASGHVVGVTVDIYHLDYFASRAHFSAHCIAIYGLDAAVAHVVDTTQQGGAQELPVESLRRARGSSEGFMPSPNRYLHLDGLPTRVQTDLDSLLLEQSWPAIAGAAARVLDDRGKRFGLGGLRRAAADMRAWEDELADPVGQVPEVGRFWRYAGTGGTNFRGLFHDFLREVEIRADDGVLGRSVQDFGRIRHQWVHLIDRLISHADAADRHENLEAAHRELLAIADAEEEAFARLLALAIGRAGGRS